jgi:hypothetical protein
MYVLQELWYLIGSIPLSMSYPGPHCRGGAGYLFPSLQSARKGSTLTGGHCVCRFAILRGLYLNTLDLGVIQSFYVRIINLDLGVKFRASGAHLFLGDIGTLLFRTLHGRLIEHIKARVRNGEITERKLANITGISQPHVHNLLKGTRRLSPDSADCLLRNLHLSVVDLLEPLEVEQHAQSSETKGNGQLPGISRGPAGRLSPN